MSEVIYHMCPTEAWMAAIAAGRYEGTEDDRRDGFIHFSTAAQVRESARRHRSGQAGLVLIAVEAGRLGDRLRWEESRGGALFPHLYGWLSLDEALDVIPLPLGPHGEHLFPPLCD